MALGEREETKLALAGASAAGNETCKGDAGSSPAPA